MENKMKHIDWDDINEPQRAPIQLPTPASKPKTMRRLGPTTLAKIPKYERNLRIRNKIADILISPYFVGLVSIASIAILAYSALNS